MVTIELPNKEYVLQHDKHGYRCISWHPHYIMTNWVKTKSLALRNGERYVKDYYKGIEECE